MLVATLIVCNHDKVNADLLRALLGNWDARLYLSVAEHGYETTGDPANFIVFFPLYPLLIRYLSDIVEPVFAGLAITTVTSIAGHTLLILYLQRLGFTPKQAWRSTVLFFAFPSAVFFTALYTESLFLLLSVCTLTLLHRERHGWAGLLGFCAALTRPVGILLLVPFAFSLFRGRPFSIRWRTLLPFMFVPAGFCLYLAINYAVHGDPFFYLARQSENWGKHLTNPVNRFWIELVSFYGHQVDWTHPLQLDKLVSLMSPIVIGLYLIATRRESRALPIYLTIWAAAHCLLFLSQSFWLSNTRYFMLVFPLFPMLERLTAGHPIVYSVLLLGSAAYAIYGTYLYAIGWWAF